jgi:hypothetical protein
VSVDKTAPTVSCSASPGKLWPADDKLVPITVKVKIQDSRSGARAARAAKEVRKARRRAR